MRPGVFGVKDSAVSVACKRVRERAAKDKQFGKRLDMSRKTIIQELKT